MRKRSLVVLLLLACMLQAFSWSVPAVRRSVGNGPLYPESRDALIDSLYRMYGKVDGAPPEPYRLAACIVPHSAYGLSGAVAAHAFRHLSPGDYKRVVILGAATASRFEGCSIPKVAAYQTPLGMVPLDWNAIDRISRHPLIDLNALNYRQPSRGTPIHENESSIELVLPFLQERLGKFGLVPIIVGSLADGDGQWSAKTVDTVAKIIAPLLDSQTLLIVTAEFTHFGEGFGFTPFRDNILEEIKTLDGEAFQLLMERDFAGFENYLKRTKNPITGAESIRLLLHLLPYRARGRLLAYETSGNLLNTTRQSVSYAALAFYDLEAPLVYLEENQGSAPQGIEPTEEEGESNE
jgi:MEMO1 family protein